jgi:flavin reductase (DIM6/NTAB) family NADH-FMN oxidoreductase RutF
MIIDPSKLPTSEVYKLLTGAVLPRPIAWVSTVSKEGINNLAPYSFFTVASRQPPTLCISIGEGIQEREGTVKDTLVNIQEMEDFVINIASLTLGNEMHNSSINFQSEVDEFKAVGVTAVRSEKVHSPRVLEAPISMECKLHRIIQIGTDHLVLGQVVCYHIHDDVYLEPNKVNLEKLNPIGRLAGGKYTLVEKVFGLPHEGN